MVFPLEVPGCVGVVLPLDEPGCVGVVVAVGFGDGVVVLSPPPPLDEPPLDDPLLFEEPPLRLGNGSVPS